MSVAAANLADYKPTDLCSLFANALENAINACKLVQTAKTSINNSYSSISGTTSGCTSDYGEVNSNRIITLGGIFLI